MSDGPRMPRPRAEHEACRFRDMVIARARTASLDGAAKLADLTWIVAGSVRRCARTVGDIDHVIIQPTILAEVSDGLFTKQVARGLVWHALDLLTVERSGCTKSIKSDGSTRWGDRYRSVEFDGVTHEIYAAQPETIGSILTIRTGPGDLGMFLMQRLKRRMIDAGVGMFLMQRLKRRGCTHDQGRVYGSDGSIIPMRTETDFFRVCGMPYIPPTQRDEACFRLRRNINHDEWRDIAEFEQPLGITAAGRAALKAGGDV